MRAKVFVNRLRFAGGTAMGSVALVLTATLLLGGCKVLDDLLAVDVRNQILADRMDDPSQADLLVRSVQSDFECAFGTHIIVMGLLSGELAYFGPNQGMTAYEARVFPTAPGGGNCDNATTIGLYGVLNGARWFADDVTRKLESWTDAQVANRSLLIATTAAYAGYALILIGESQCSAVIDGGPKLTPAQVFAAAEDRFTKAIGAAPATTAGTDILNMSRVGRARARLNLGRKTDAGADARLVPVNYVHNYTASATNRRRMNRVFDWNNTLRNVGVKEFEVRPPVTEQGGVADPRVQLTLATQVQTRNLWLQSKFTSLTATIPVASGDEAQLIVAEADGPAAALGIINTFHARAGLPAFSGTDPEIMDHLIKEERRRELFLESQRVGDMRRYGFPFLPAAGTRYVGGSFAGDYGNTECMGLPEVEIIYNPNIQR